MTRVFLAILTDTWRQSKQQLVFLLVMGAMGVFSIGWVLLCRVAPTPAGTYVATFPVGGQPKFGYEVMWDGQYAELLVGEKRRRVLAEPQVEYARAAAEEDRLARDLYFAQAHKDPPEVQASIAQELKTAQARSTEKEKTLKKLSDEINDEARKLIEERAGGISPLEKGVEVWLSWGVLVLVYLAILGFIAAGSGYFPAMLAAGAVDVLVAKPVTRAAIFLGKYLSGLLLMSAAVFGALILLFIGTGFKTGIWHVRLFAAMPVIVFIVALIYAVVLCVGVLTRSTPLAIVVGYIYYGVIEMGIYALQRVDEWVSGAGVDMPTLRTIGEVMRWGFPGFARLHSAAEAAVLDIPIFDWQPLIVGTVWLAVLLGAAYAWFARTDF